MSDARAPDGKWKPGVAPAGAHLFKKGQSGNPGGRFKRVAECQKLALDETPASFKLLIAQRDDANEDSRVRQAAAKLLIAYGIGDPPKEVRVDSGHGGVDAMDELTVEELRALARQSLADDVPEADEDAGDDSDEVEH